ncbi:MAG: DUF2779 domain-containing protein [Clostridia bacterium]|nr:DUF2779 domain-containing protein [Clostridia bacterium]
MEFSKDKERMVNETQKAIEAGHKTIAEASFIYNGMFCSVDVLVINDDGTISFYEVKSASEVKEINNLDVAYQYAVLKELGYEIKHAYIMYANSDYYFNKGESIDFEKLFVVEEQLESCIELLPVVQEEIASIRDAIRTGNAPEHEFSSSCNSPYECPFMQYCIKEAGMPEDSNIFNITGPKFTATKLNKWYYNGIHTYKDIVDKIPVSYKKNGEPKDASWKYVQQAKAYLEKENPPVNMEELGKFLETITYPIASFDYEGFATAVPHYYGLKPSQQVVFQFSYDYIEEEGAQRQHFDFLAKPGTDPRLDLCNALAKLPKANTILVWNKTYEKSRNLEMAELEGFEKFKDMLLEMVDNMVDLMIPFRERIIYLWKANGSYSLKPITEAMIPNLQYRDLKVHNGTEAAVKFCEMPNMTEGKKKECIQNLKFYNNQDTYGPLKILEKMFRIYKNDEDFILFTDKSQKDMLGQEMHIGDTVTCDEGIAVITRFTEKYAVIMLMHSGREVRRKCKSLVLIQEYVTDKPRNISTKTDKLVYNDIVTCNRGLGKVYGFTPCFVRIKLTDGFEILRMRHKINKIKDAEKSSES